MKENWKTQVFNYLNYKDYINYVISRNKDKKAYRTLLARGAGCQRTFLSTVLHSHVELTPDHAIQLASFWEMAREQAEFFLTLVQLSRAATKELKKHLQVKLEELKEKRSQVERSISAKPADTLTSGDSYYYGDWKNAAIHLLVSIPQFQTVKSLSLRLGEAEENILERLKKLETLGLITQINHQWKMTRKTLHVPRNSPYYASHHLNWRMKSLVNLMQEPSSVHVTGVYSLSQTDFQRLKEMVYIFLSTSKDIVEHSKE